MIFDIFGPSIQIHIHCSSNIKFLQSKWAMIFLIINSIQSLPNFHQHEFTLKNPWDLRGCLPVNYKLDVFFSHYL